jgi:hypothetical protein
MITCLAEKDSQLEYKTAGIEIIKPTFQSRSTILVKTPHPFLL